MDYRQYFIEKERTDGTKYTYLKDGAPNELDDLIHDIHYQHFFKCLPNNWIYETIHLAFEELNLDSLENITIEADIWNHELTKWLYDNCNTFAHEYCNEFLQEIYEGERYKRDLLQIISGGQRMAKERIYQAVNEWLEERKEITE